MTLQDLLDACRETGYLLQTGATPQALEMAEKELDCTFPELMRTWYADHDGMPASAPYLYDADSEIQARVCDILGQRRYEPAIDRLAEIVRHGASPNAPGAAIRALGSIGSEPARARLLELSITLPKYSAEIRYAMRPGR